LFEKENSQFSIFSSVADAAVDRSVQNWKLHIWKAKNCGAV
jgi:hypothetical protein